MLEQQSTRKKNLHSIQCTELTYLNRASRFRSLAQPDQGQINCSTQWKAAVSTSRIPRLVTDGDFVFVFGELFQCVEFEWIHWHRK